MPLCSKWGRSIGEGFETRFDPYCGASLYSRHKLKNEVKKVEENFWGYFSRRISFLPGSLGKQVSKLEKLKADLIEALILLLSALAFFGAFLLLVSSFGGLSQVIHNYLWIPLALVTIGLLFSSGKFERVGKKGSVIIRTLTIFSVLLGLIPIIEIALFLNMDAASSVLLFFYVIDAAFVLLISFPVLSRVRKTIILSIGWGTIPSEGSKPILSKVTYHNGQYAGHELILPTVCAYYLLKSFTTIEEKPSESLLPLKTEVNCCVSKYSGEYQLRLSRITFEAADVRRDTKENVYAYLDRINIYLNGVLSSSITFHEDEDIHLKRTLIPIINHGSSNLFIMSPVIMGIKKGNHIITVEFLDSLGKILDKVNVGFAVFDWMRDGETWSVVPATLSISGFEDSIPAAIYSKEQRLSKRKHQDIEQADKITVISVKVNTSFMRKELDRRRVKDFEVTLETLDDYLLKAIDITINDSLKFKFVVKEQMRLMKEHRYVMRLTIPLLLDLPLGKHALILRLFGKSHLDLVEEERELLAFAKEFVCKERRRVS